MCGIVGFTGHREEGVLERMTRALAHRGPDGEGLASAPARGDGVHFGHRRLAVIDLDGGAQPMWTEDGRWLLVFNGEIYNFMELRERLVQEGQRFRTRSDTEVLLHLLARGQLDCLDRLDGMFAFAAFDTVERRLLLAVDRFGQKPLSWMILPDGRFLFASEITALRHHPAWTARLDPLSVCRMLAFNAPPAPHTIWRGVRRLEAGTALLARLDREGRVQDHRVLRWWQPLAAPDAPRSRPSTDEYIDALRTSVQRHLVSDVPLGVFLSGGVDSTAVAALAAERRQILTLSMGFGEGAFDESPQARATATALGTRHVEFRLSPRDALTVLDNVIAALDEPLADAGCLPASGRDERRQSRPAVAATVARKPVEPGVQPFEGGHQQEQAPVPGQDREHRAHGPLVVGNVLQDVHAQDRIGLEGAQLLPQAMVADVAAKEDILRRPGACPLDHLVVDVETGVADGLRQKCTEAAMSESNLEHRGSQVGAEPLDDPASVAGGALHRGRECLAAGHLPGAGPRLSVTGGRDRRRLHSAPGRVCHDRVPLTRQPTPLQ